MLFEPFNLKTVISRNRSVTRQRFINYLFKDKRDDNVQE